MTLAKEPHAGAGQSPLVYSIILTWHCYVTDN